MYPTTPEPLDLKDFVKGSVQMNGINFYWDFTDLLKEQKKTEFMIVTKSGRIIIPSMNIY